MVWEMVPRDQHAEKRYLCTEESNLFRLLNAQSSASFQDNNLDQGSSSLAVYLAELIYTFIFDIYKERQLFASTQSAG